MRNMKLEKGDKILPQNYPACSCKSQIQERERMFKKLKKMSPKLDDLDVKVKKVEEELKRLRTTRKRRVRSPSGVGR
jgi:hypothetical protein